MKFIGLVLLLVFFLPAQASAQTKAAELKNQGLVVRGQITRLEVQKEKNAVLFFVTLEVEFANAGVAPIVLFKPSVESNDPGLRFWLGGWSLYGTEAEANGGGRGIFNDGYWESVMGSDFYRQLAQQLDVKTPPDEYTRVLRPKELWKTQDNFRIYFEADKHGSWPERKTWKEMQEFPAKLWLTIDYELSPWNVEFFKPNLIRKLRTRWKDFGKVLIEQKKEGRFNHFMATSEPMTIDFGQAVPKATPDK